MTDAPRRSRYSFSLGRLLWAFVVLSFVFAGARWCYVRVYTQALAVRDLKALGVTPEYSGYYLSVADGGPTWYGFGESRPNDFKNAVVGVRIGVPFGSEKDARRVNELLRQLPYLEDVAAKPSEARVKVSDISRLADEHFTIAIAGLPIRGADLDCRLVGGRTVELLADVEALRGLKTDDEITPADLAVICGNPTLRRLRLFHSAPSHEHMSILAAATHLTHLDLSNPPVESLPALAHCELRFGSKEYTDEDLINVISKLPKLKVLGLNSNVQITDEGLASLRAATQLQDLYLRDAINITDAGIAPLAELSQLNRINLDGTQVTEEGIIKLCGSKHLRETTVSSQLDVDRLREVLPHANISTHR